MRTASFATSDPPTLPAAVLTARLPVRSTAVASPRAQPARARRSLFARLMIDLVLCLRLACGVVEGLLAVRAVLTMLGGDPSAAFSAFVYGATGPMLVPFADVFHGALTVAGQRLDATAILAIVVLMLGVRLVEAALKTLARL